MKYYAEDGCRLTDCCGCYSTYMDAVLMGGEQVLCCKQCYLEVPHGQGDGSEYKVIDDLVLNEILDDDARDPDYYLGDN